MYARSRLVVFDHEKNTLSALWISMLNSRAVGRLLALDVA
jgi:hypothetical protein